MKENEKNQHSTPARWDASSPDGTLVAAWHSDHEGRIGQGALALLLSRYRDRVYGWCWRQVHDRELALDLAQEVLVSAYRGLAGFDERARFSTWLFAIARNRCLSELRKRRLPMEDGAFLEFVADSRPTPDRELEGHLAEAALNKMIREHLTQLEQDALWLGCVERVSVDEITRLLDIREPSGARAVLQRARRRLRSALDRRDAGDLEGS